MWILLAASLALAPPPAAPAPARAKRAAAQAARASELQRVLRLQVLLDRARFSPGEIDGRMGGNVRAALRAYCSERVGNAVGASEELLLEALAANDAAPILVTYTILPADVEGPFHKIPADMMAMAKLPYLGYGSALEGLGEKFHASPELLRRLNPGRRFVAGTRIEVPNVERGPVPAASKIAVRRHDSSVSALDARGRLLARYPATMGSEHDPLPVGTWKVTGVHRDPPFHYNPDLFWDARPEHSKVKLAPGPNNPVGVVWIDLSKEHYGIHGTPEPSRIGKTQSHGCIRLTNWDARELARMVAPGVPAVLSEQP